MRLSTAPRRRGTILIVVLALLALFAVIGLSFVLYAGSEATSSRIYREAQDIATAQPNPDGELAAIAALGDIIYDKLDDTSGMYSAIRGHGIARDMYGWYYTGTPGNPIVRDPATGLLYNTVPYAGVGEFDENVSTALGNISRRMLLNFSLFPNMAPNGGATGAAWPGTLRFPTPERTGNRNTPFGAVTGNYVGLNANYTYPDTKTLFLGLANPLNGQVLIPSYHRPWIFGPFTPPGQPGANPNWTNNLGRHLLLRPRPIDQNNGNQFPYVPQNADGTYSGDLQNLPGAVYPHAGNPALLIPKNDSVWVDFGAPVQYWNGKRYKPLFATLVLPLNNRVNLSASGNTRGTGQLHDSGMGFGPWEVNPLRVLNDASKDPRANTEYQRLMMDRYGANQAPVVSPVGAPPTVVSTSLRGPGGITTRLFGNTTPSDYAPLDWDGGAPVGSIRMMLPGLFNDKMYATTPRWNDPTNPTLARYGNGDPTSVAADPGERDNHPSLFNPYFVGTIPNPVTGHTFPAADLARLDVKFGDDTGLSTTSSAGALAPYSLGTFSTAGGIAVPVGRSPANANRMNVTTISNSLAVPTIMPGYAGDGKDYTGYQFQAGGLPFPVRIPNQPVLTPGQLGPDVSLNPNQPVTTVQMRAVMTHLQGTVDLNRPLTEYRKAPATPLSPVNIYNPAVAGEDAVYLQAWTDRQLLARDVFNRLVIATGASAAIDPNGSGYMFPTVLPGSPEYDALRYLAQLAVNIVDFIDADDVSTAFVWNPTPNAPFHTAAANFDPNPTAVGFIGNRVVFGVEKPKLVTNEVYAELTNNPSDKPPANRAQQGNHLRFWIELLNPETNEAVPGKAIGGKPLPAINPSTRLYYGAGDVVDGAAIPIGFSPYVVQVYLNGSQVLTDLKTAANVTGGISPTATMRVNFNFASSQPAMRTLAPNAGQYGNPAAAGQSPGFVLLGPDLTALGGPAPTVEFDPATTIAGAAGAMIAVPQDTVAGGMNQLHYQYPNPLDEQGITTELTALNTPASGQPTVVLRRLANPYLPANDPLDPTHNPGGTFDPNRPVNPYLTVDVAGQNRVNDAVRVGSDSHLPGKERPNKTMANLPPPQTERSSVGRLQPLFAMGTVAQVTVDAANPKNTLLRHNGSAAGAAATGDPTLQVPFEWMVHMDRPLVNAMEATFAAAVPSHQLTQVFLDLAGMKQKHLAPWTPEHAAPLAAELKVPAADLVNQAALYRALELLSVKPWTYGTPNAGKVAGKININLVWDPRVLWALADPQSGNFFSQTDLFNPVDLRDPKTVYGRLMEARRGTTPPAQAIQRAFDPANPTTNINTWAWTQVPGQFDTPIRSFGTAVPNAYDPTIFPGTTRPNTLGVNSTPARTVTHPSDNVERGLFSVELAPQLQHPFLRQEVLRKIENNLTTTTDTFAVYMTVGFFEVTNSPPYNVNNRPALGKELFKDMPGDLRQRFFAVIDRTNLTIDGSDPSFRTQGPKPFITELVSAMPAGTSPQFQATQQIRIIAQPGTAGTSLTVNFEGQAFTVGNGTVLRLGTGAKAERVTVVVNGANPISHDLATGIGTLSVTRVAAQAAEHLPGDRVMNDVIPGNPGPQSTFNPRLPNFQAVVPYFGKIE